MGKFVVATYENTDSSLDFMTTLEDQKQITDYKIFNDFESAYSNLIKNQDLNKQTVLLSAESILLMAAKIASERN